MDELNFTRSVLNWYDSGHRDLPWRRTKDAYSIWVSEIMLQQTRAETVIPYYERFLSHYPDVHALASAPQEELLKLWEGLGYYSRARSLQKAAQISSAGMAGCCPPMRSSCVRFPASGIIRAERLRQSPSAFLFPPWMAMSSA